MIIEQPTFFLRWIYPHALWRINPKEHAVYLTFDDGPIPESTPFILRTLEQYGAKATFFCVGDNVRKYPELFEQIKAAGHQVGNHTYNHMGCLRHLVRTYLKNIDQADQLIHSRLFRPPHGWMWGTTYRRIMYKKYKIVMWDLVTRDYSRSLTAYDVVRNVQDYTRDGSIITFHDSLKSIQKLYFALPASLRWLKSQGYEFKVIEE